MSIPRKIYDKALFTAECVVSCRASAAYEYRLAGIVGGTTTHNLRDRFIHSGVHPAHVVACMHRLRDEIKAKVRSCESMARSFRRHPPRSALFNVDAERGWLKVIDEVVDRAESAAALWAACGGAKTLQQNQTKSEEGALVTAAPSPPQVIEIHPSFNIQIIQPEKSGPAEVVVISLPTRETTTQIERDDSGDIISTTQVQRDAA